MKRDKIALHKLCNEFEDEELVEELVNVIVMEVFKQSDRVVKEDELKRLNWLFERDDKTVIKKTEVMK